MSRYVDLYEPDSGPFQEGQSGPVPKVSVLEKADCIIIQKGNPVSWKKVEQRKICKNGKGTCFCFRCLLLWRPRVLTIYTNWQGGILEHEYNTMKFDVVEERTASMHILISWNGVLKWHRLKTQPSLPPTMLPKRNAQIIWFSNQNFPWKFRSVCRYCVLYWLPLFFLKTLTNAQKAPAVAVNCAMTTTEVLRVIVVAGTGYKAIKNLVLVSILMKSNYVELTCQMICISLIS